MVRSSIFYNYYCCVISVVSNNYIYNSTQDFNQKQKLVFKTY